MLYKKFHSGQSKPRMKTLPSSLLHRAANQYTFGEVLQWRVYGVKTGISYLIQNIRTKTSTSSLIYVMNNFLSSRLTKSIPPRNYRIASRAYVIATDICLYLPYSRRGPTPRNNEVVSPCIWPPASLGVVTYTCCMT